MGGTGPFPTPGGRRLERYPTRPPEVGLAGFRDHCFLCQPTVFWRRSLALLLGPWDATLHCAFDFDTWIRAFRAVPDRIGKLAALQAQTRRHPDTLSARQTCRTPRPTSSWPRPKSCWAARRPLPGKTMR